MTLFTGIAFVVLVALLLCLSLVDLRERRLPNALVLGVALLGLVLAAVQCVYSFSLLPLQNALLGMLLAAVPAAVFSLLYYLLRGQEGFGMGDLKLLAALGLYLGLAGLWVLPLACVCAVLVMLCQVIFRMLVRLPHHFQQTDTRQTGIPTREKVQRHTIAFGPFIALAAVILVVVG